MKKFNRFLFSAAAVLMAAGSVGTMAACNGDGAVSGITTGDVNVVAYNGEKVTISFYHCMGSALKGILADGIEDFNEMYPNIEVQATSFGDYPGVRDQISTEISSKRAPSLAYCYPDHVALYNKSAAVLPLDKHIESTITQSKADGSTEQLGLTQAQIDDYVPIYYNEGKIYDDAGTMYTLPMLKSTELLYYNKTYFDNYNATCTNEADKLKVPTTWDEMEETCAKILAIENAKEGGKEKNPCIPLGYDSGANWFITMTEQLNSGYTISTAERQQQIEETGSGSYFTFNNETNRAFVERFREWYQKGYVTTEEIFGSYTSDLFTQIEQGKTKTYMCIGSSAGAGYQCPDPKADKSYPFEVGVAMIPQADTENPTMISQGPSICLFKKQNEQEVAAAWLFAKFITSNIRFQANCSKNNGYTPVIQSIKNDSVYKNFLNKADGNKYLQASSVLLTMEMKDYYFVSPAFIGSSTARDDMATLMKNCFKQPLEGKTASQLVKSQFDKIELGLKKYDR